MGEWTHPVLVGHIDEVLGLSLSVLVVVRHDPLLHLLPVEEAVTVLVSEPRELVPFRLHPVRHPVVILVFIVIIIIVIIIIIYIRYICEV